ncbi:MAG: hypothetical protein PHD97_09410, partial [Bacteroidales bacterium]|nr:hypothetical protein [Bacteroidales bacterium]
MVKNNKYLNFLKPTYFFRALVFIFFIGTIKISFSQDTRFTQSFSNPLKLNPAIMGANPDLKIILSY